MSIDYTPSFDVLSRLKELLELNHMSVYRLSKLTSIPQSSIATWFQKNYYPPIDKLEIICHVFGISLAEFFYREEDSIDIVTAKDVIHLKQWHRLSSDQQDLLHSLMIEMR